MSRSSDFQKLSVWRGRFERFSSCGLPVGRFCARERVSVASFCYWRKKLGPGFIARAMGQRRRSPDPSASERGGVFRPVTVVPAASGVRIHLPGGTRIEVGTECSEAVRAVVAEVVRLDRGVHVAGVDRGSDARPVVLRCASGDPSGLVQEAAAAGCGVRSC